MPPRLSQVFYSTSSPIFLPPTKPVSFFCAVEWSWEKKTRVPIRFRLGTQEYVDRLEGKNLSDYNRSNKSLTPGLLPTW
jgi:hypothetical protein